jgi:hypothetical protein
MRCLRSARPLASHSTTAPRTGIPTSASARAQARSVAPVVTTSSASRTGPGGFTADRTSTEPARFEARAAASSPIESRVRRASPSSGRTSACPIRAQSLRTWSPPRARAAAGREGTGTTTAPAGTSAPSDADSGATRSRRPRSL